MKMRKRISTIIGIMIVSMVLCFNSVSANAAITVYSQTDSRWGSYPYGRGPNNAAATLSSAGCGVLSYVNAIYYLNGNFINPKTLADYSVSNGHRINGSGTSETLYKAFADSHGSEYGFEYAGRVKNVSEARAYLQQGCTGALHVQEHWMALVDYDSSNSKYLVLDSYKSSNRGTYTNGYRWMTSGEFTGKMALAGTYSVYLFKSIVPPPDPLTIDTRYKTPCSVYPLATSGKITVYTNGFSAYSQSEHYIDANDLCTLKQVYTNGFCKVSYPTGSTTAERMAKLSDFVQGGVTPYSYSPSVNTEAFTKSNMSTHFGSVFSTDACTVVGKSGSKLQVIYPITGGYKCGWINPPGADPIPETSDLKVPILGYNASPSARTTVYQYTSTLGGTKYGEIFVDDLCTINSVNISGKYVNVTYPISGGTKTGYVYLDQFFPYLNSSGSVYSVKVSSNTTVYRKSDMSESIGTAYTTDTIYVLGKTGNKLQIEYPITEGTNAGKYKMGWITSDKIVKNLTRIAVTSNPSKTNYMEGESLNTSGLVVTAYYDDGSTANVTGSCNISGYTNTPGVKTVSVSYSGKTTSFSVVVNKKTPVSLSVSQMPDKTVYIAGEELDLAGLKVTAAFNNNTSQDVTSDIIWSTEEDFDEAGVKSVTVAYEYNDKLVSTSFNITVNAKSVTGLSVKNQPLKRTYKKGETINTTGLELTASYNDGSSQTITSGYSCTPTVLNTVGDQVITVSYGGASTQFHVTVEDNVVFEITSHPSSVQAAAGDPVVMKVTATGNDLGYQWQWSADGSTWKNCTSSGCNTNTFRFTMKETFNGRRYRCVVTSGSQTLVSGAATATMEQPAADFEITQHPQDAAASAGAKVQLHVGAKGTNLTYQWQWSSNGSTWKNCTSTGYNRDTFTFTMKEVLDGRLYRCVVSSGGSSIPSNAAEVSLKTGQSTVTITAQPQDAAAAPGGTVVLTVKATGTNLTYQWQWSSNGSTWKNCTSTGYNKDTFRFTMKEVLDGREYRCVVSSGSDSVTSGSAMISLAGEMIHITEHPMDFYGSEGETVRVHVAAEGTGLSYQWQWSTGGSTWKNCTSTGYNRDTFTFKMKSTLDGRLYRCVVSDSQGNTATSDAAEIVLTGQATANAAALEAGVIEAGVIEETVNEDKASVNETAEAAEELVNEATGPAEQEEPAEEADGELAEKSEETADPSEEAGTEEEADVAETDEEADALEEGPAAVEADPEKAVPEESAESEEEAEPEETAEYEENAEPEEEEIVLTIDEDSYISSHDGPDYVISMKAEGEGVSYQWQYKSAGENDWKDFEAGTVEGMFANVNGADSSSLSFSTADVEMSFAIRCVVSDENGEELISEMIEFK